MGQSESQPTADTPVPSPHLPTSRYAPQNASVAQIGLAFHVLRVAERSPADEGGIEPFFDFVCGVNGRPLGDDIDLLTRMSEQFEERQISLQVYSTKRKELRDAQIVPSRAWSSTGVSSSAAPGARDGGGASLLGLSLRLCDPQHALDQVWHVLEILEGSPAQSAGLVPFGDWIVGYAGGILRGEGDFYDVVESHVDKPLRLYVYNADYDVTRETILIPNRSWGGEGLLGCGVGYGLLHRIPKPQDRTRIGPNDDGGPEERMPREEGMAGIGLLANHSKATIGGTTTSPPPPPKIKKSIYSPPPPTRTLNAPTTGGIYVGAGGVGIDLGGGGGRRTESVASTTYSDLSPPPTTTRGRELLIDTPPSEREQLEDDEEEEQETYDERYGGYASEGVQVIPISMDAEGEEHDFVVSTGRHSYDQHEHEGDDDEEEDGEEEEVGDGGGHFMQRAMAARLGVNGAGTNRSGPPPPVSTARAGGTWSSEGYQPPHSPWRPPPSPALAMESRSAV